MTVTLKPQLPFPLLPASAPSTTADLLYFVPPANNETPYLRLYIPKEGEKETNVVHETRSGQRIYDLRSLVDEKGGAGAVDVTGFQALGKEVAKTSMTEADFGNEETIKTKYYAEIDELLKRTLGATRTAIFDHTIRRKEKPGEETPDTAESRKPVTQVHIDQTPASGRKRVYRHLGQDAERLLRGKAALINVWRPLRGPVLDAPLAVADARTLYDEDLVNSRLIYEAPLPEGETSSIKYSDRHQWFYLSKQQPDEALLLKCWDNGEQIGARTPHTGIVDDAFKGQDVQLRQSIEVRVLVFWEDEANRT